MSMIRYVLTLFPVFILLGGRSWPALDRVLLRAANTVGLGVLTAIFVNSILVGHDGLKRHPCGLPDSPARCDLERQRGVARSRRRTRSGGCRSRYPPHRPALDPPGGRGRSIGWGRRGGCNRTGSTFLATFLAPIDRGSWPWLRKKRAAWRNCRRYSWRVYRQSCMCRPGTGNRARCLLCQPASEAVLGYATPDWLAAPTLWLDRLALEDRDRVVAERSVAHGEGRALVGKNRVPPAGAGWTASLVPRRGASCSR